MAGESAGGPEPLDKISELSHLTAAVGHHVINAYSAIVSNAELIRSHAFDATDASELDTLATAIVDTAVDASQVARRLIDWARRDTGVESDPAHAQANLVDLNQLIRERVESEKSSARPQAEWVLDLGSIPRFRGSSAALSAMFGNILRNAQEALPRGVGAVAVSSAVDSRNWLVISIRDSGCGMTPEVLKRATEPFFSTKTDQGGVGLTIAQVIWRRHRGAMSIESVAGQGTTIRLSFGPLPALSVAPSPDAT
jgi:signal transduction histidine kinase